MEEQEKKQETQQSERSRYRNSFGATILFSGVQFYQIFISIVKSKFVALFIGPLGMGITSLLRTTTDLISATTNLGLKTSGVKSVAASYADNNVESIVRTITVLRRLILLTGVLGMLICALFSPLWSEMSFGNNNYTFSFLFVSFIILFDQLNNGELVLLQGMQQRKALAKANFVGQTLSVLLTVPLYYFYGIKAIVWVLVLSSLVAYAISKYYTHQLRLSSVTITWKETFMAGREMIKLGVFLSLQYLMSQLIVYIVRNYVSNRGGVEEVGLYSAGTSIITSYLGLIFAAIATDYFPKLAATKNSVDLERVVHTQAEISILLFTPLIVAFIIFIKPLIILLYSNQFLSIEYMLYWSVGATLIQSMGWAMSHPILAKAKPLQFFLNELVAACYSVPLRLLGYSLWGLTGFGVATFATYFIYLIQEMIVNKKLFGLLYNKAIWFLFFILNLFVVSAVSIKLLLPLRWGYAIGTVLLIMTSLYTLLQLNRKMDLIPYLKRRLRN